MRPETDAQQFASPVKKADRRSRSADFLMTERIVAPRLADIYHWSIERIRRVLDGVTLEAFEQNWEKRWLVERGIEIISEASRHLTDNIKEREPKFRGQK
jgi:epoxyqueuosine reductase QueG